jgi:hypothetical protein
MGKGNGLSDNCLTFTVIILNVICGVLGALIFALAMWMRLEPEVKDWVKELGATQYWTGLYILMAAGCLIMIISFLGCCGALTANSCLLGSSALLVFAALILELAGAIYILVNGTETSSLTPFLENTFNRLMIDSNYNERANRILQVVQEKIGCCGANNYQDYTRNRLPVSDYCRDHVSGNIYQEGCVQQLSIFIEKRAGWIAGIALFVGLLQIVLVCTSLCFWRNMREKIPGQPREYTEVPQKAY